MCSVGLARDYELVYLLEQRLATCRNDPTSEFNKIMLR
jgi:hypothetical protein